MEKEIKNPQVSQEMYASIKDILNGYTAYATEGDMAFEVDDESVIKIWKKHIKPYSDAIAPLTDELIALDKLRGEKEQEYKEILEKCEAKDAEIRNLDLKRSKFITRVSPIIIRKYQDKINEYQQFGSIIEKDGKVYVVIKDWLASFISGHKKRVEAHNEKVTSKITNTKIVANE